MLLTEDERNERIDSFLKRKFKEFDLDQSEADFRSL